MFNCASKSHKTTNLQHFLANRLIVLNCQVRMKCYLVFDSKSQESLMKLLHLTRRYLRSLHIDGYVQNRSRHRLQTFRAKGKVQQRKLNCLTVRRLNYKVCVTSMDKPYTGKFVRYYILCIMYKKGVRTLTQVMAAATIRTLSVVLTQIAFQYIASS